MLFIIDASELTIAAVRAANAIPFTPTGSRLLSNQG